MRGGTRANEGSCMTIQREEGGRFAKGVSANPGGRPAIVEQVRDLARLETEASIKALAGIRDDKRAPAQARVAAALGLLDRGWGRPAQQVQAEVSTHVHEHRAIEMVIVDSQSASKLELDERPHYEPIATRQ